MNYFNSKLKKLQHQEKTVVAAQKDEAELHAAGDVVGQPCVNLTVGEERSGVTASSHHVRYSLKKKRWDHTSSSPDCDKPRKGLFPITFAN